MKSISLESHLTQGLSRTTLPRGALRGHLVHHTIVNEKSKARIENVFLLQYKAHHLDRDLQSSLWKAGGGMAQTLQEKLLGLTRGGYQSSRKVGSNLNHPEERSLLNSSTIFLHHRLPSSVVVVETIPSPNPARVTCRLAPPCWRQPQPFFIFYPGTNFSSPLIIPASCSSSDSSFFISL